MAKVRYALPQPKSIMRTSLSVGSFFTISPMNSRYRLIWRNLSYFAFTTFPSFVCTPSPTRKSMGCPSSRIYCFTRLCAGASHFPFSAPLHAAAPLLFFFFMVTFPFLLTSTVTICVSETNSACRKLSLIYADNRSASSSPVQL